MVKADPNYPVEVKVRFRSHVVPLSLVFLGVAGLCPGTLVAAQGEEILRVGVRDAPPFVIRAADGSWEGVSIFLWEEIARRHSISYEYEEADLDGLVSGVEEGRFDIGVAPLTITVDRERRLDFTHAYYTTGLGIAIPSRVGGSWIGVLRRALSSEFLGAVAALGLLLLATGMVIWLLERRKNPEQFGGGPLHGLGAGFWWSAVTMTTVGYGDKSPKSAWGRFVAIIWMFAAIIMISGFTAAITSSLTVNQLESIVESVDDLKHVRVGALDGSTSAQYLSALGIRQFSYGDVSSGVQAIREGVIDAMVHDAPVLLYEVRSLARAEVRVLPFTFEPQYYGLALPAGSELREPINRLLLEIIDSDEWPSTLERYMGS
jgi:ABC-type amino acid transport substrate-binding protein